jgi:ferredoxin-NADP reductase
MMGVKFYPDPSTFKQHLLEMKRGDALFASQLSGDFVMPRDKGRKLVFISGGIGVTPFRSMLKYLVDRNEKRDIVHFFSNKRAADIVYEDIFDEAQRRLGIKTIYTITDPKSPDYTGHVDGDMIKTEAPDYLERYFYISGPRAMVLGFKETLSSLGVARSHIKTDYFPGFA